MREINKVKALSIWVFIIPFMAVNTCLVLITQFQFVFPNQEDIIHNTIPYIDGGASISRVVRPYPAWLIFKPLMFVTSFLLIKYWLYNKTIIIFFHRNYKDLKKIIFFGIASAISLSIHSIFLGIHLDNDLYKLFRRVIMLSFIIFEIIAQVYLVKALYSFGNKISKYINKQYLILKIYLVSALVLVAILSIPILISGNSFFGFNTKFFKHGLEWNFFLGVIFFYVLTFFMWKKN